MLNKLFRIGAISILMLCIFSGTIFVGLALANNERTEFSSSLQVTGTAVVTGTPDLAYITVGVETKNASAEVASQENADRMAQVLTALKELGLTDKQITTSGYNIYSSNQIIDRGTENEITITTYHVQNRISIITKDLDNVGKIIDAAIKAGANQIQGIRFDIEDKQEMQLLALENAVKQGKAKAEIMAKSAGITINGLASMSESYSSYAPMVNTMAVRAEALSQNSTTINPGEVEVSATVSMNFWF